MDQTLLATRVGRWFASASGRLLRFLLLAVVFGSSAPSRAATLADYLEFQPSTSPNVAGYVVHVGSSSGFFGAGPYTTTDVGTGFELVNGVGRIPLSSVISDSAYVVMRVYDDFGYFSIASNEVYVQIDGQPAPATCTSDLDCRDGDACNGAERCVSGACMAGTPLVCGNPGTCQVGWCDAAGGCVSSPVADGTTCDDGDPGTTGDVCQVGACIGTAPTPEEPTSGGSVVLYDDFEDLAAGTAPADWEVVDYKDSPAAGAFLAVTTVDGGRAFAVPQSPGTRYLAYYAGPGAETWSSYELIGRMRADDASSGIGVMIASAYPTGDEHVSLLRNGAQPSFVLGINPADSPLICASGADTGFVPVPGAWSVFRLRAIPESDGLRLQAKVWDEADPEPTGWQVDCLAQGRQAVVGRPGLIAGGPGVKWFDDIGAWWVDTSSTGGSVAPLYVDGFEDHVVGEVPDGWTQAGTGGVAAPAQPAFMIGRVPNNARALYTSDPTKDLTAYVDVMGASQWSDYEVTGRMATAYLETELGLLVYDHLHEGGGAIGLIYGSPGWSFDVRLLGGVGGACQGVSDTGVQPMRSDWQHFRVRTTTEGQSVRVQARLWREGEAEPATWQADCVAAAGAAPTAGTVGVWSSGFWGKYWDDIEVRPVTGP